MNTTIGEIIDVVLPFTTSMNIMMHGLFPYIQASLGNVNSTTRLFISIMQTSEHIYAIAVTDDVYNGNRIIPIENTDCPFIKERHFLNRSSDDLYCLKDIPFKHFKARFFNVLYSNQLIRFNPSNWKTKLIDMGFNSMKIKRTIGRSFRQLKCNRGDIADLIHVVNIEHNKFDLSSLEEKEIRCVYAKLKNMGLETTIVDKYIVKIEYERRY